MLFYREPELPAGVYSMETVVYDAPSGKSSVRFCDGRSAALRRDTLRMSSLVVVKRGEKVPEKDRRRRQPAAGQRTSSSIPNLGDPVSKTSKEVGFYFAIYPAKEGRGPDVTIELLQNGRR